MFISLILGLILSIYKLDCASIHINELFPITTSRIELIDLIKRFFDIHNLQGFYGGHQPPLYYVLTWFWIRLTGYSLFMHRFFSVTAFILVIFASKRLAQAIFEKERFIHNLTPLLIATSPFCIWWAQVFTYPAWLMLFNVLSMLFYVRLLKGRRTSDIVGYVIFTALGFYLHYFSFVLIAFQILFFAYWKVAVQKEYAKAKDFLLIQGTLLVSISPALRVFLHSIPLRVAEGRYLNSPAINRASLMPSYLKAFFDEMLLGYFLDYKRALFIDTQALFNGAVLVKDYIYNHGPHLFFILLIILCIGSALRRRRDYRFETSLILGCIIYNFLIPAVIRMGIWSVLYAGYICVFAYLLIALGAHLLRNKSFKALFCILLFSMHILSLANYYRFSYLKHENSKDPARFIEENPLKEETVLANRIPISYYYRGRVADIEYLDSNDIDLIRKAPEFYYASRTPGLADINRLKDSLRTDWDIELLKYYPSIIEGRDTYLYRVSKK